MSYSYGGYSSPEHGHAHEYLLPCVLRALGKPSGPVLDVGCGNGALVKHLLSLGFDAYGVDASASGIKLAKEGAPDRFALANIEDDAFPFQAKQFAAVIATEVIEHLYAPRVLLDLAHAVLAPSGKLILSTPYHGYLKDLALAAAGRLDAHHTVLWDGGHIKFFSRKTLEAMLSQQGFTPTSFEGAGRVPLLWKSMVITAVRSERS